jgi:hypothetical protein
MALSLSAFATIWPLQYRGTCINAFENIFCFHRQVSELVSACHRLAAEEQRLSWAHKKRWIITRNRKIRVWLWKRLPWYHLFPIGYVFDFPPKEGNSCAERLQTLHPTKIKKKCFLSEKEAMDREKIIYISPVTRNIFFLNPIVFAIYTCTFGKWVKDVYSGAFCGFWEWDFTN